ncbi:MAG: DUF488 domain-containing protein [Thermoanaerobaculum sp.]
MEIRVKRVYDPVTGDDGQRVLVDRLWPRGLSKERLAARWLPEIAPSHALRRWYAHAPERWEEFQARYAAELAGNEGLVAELVDIARRGRLTLLTASREVARSAAEVLRRYLLTRAQDWGAKSP